MKTCPLREIARAIYFIAPNKTDKKIGEDEEFYPHEYCDNSCAWYVGVGCIMFHLADLTDLEPPYN